MLHELSQFKSFQTVIIDGGGSNSSLCCTRLEEASDRTQHIIIFLLYVDVSGGRLKNVFEYFVVFVVLK